MRDNMNRRFFFIFFFCFLIGVSNSAYSAVIIKIKGKKALVDLEGVSAEPGDRFEAINLYGKALGLLQIKKIKRGKALAVLLKGKMGVNWILEQVAHKRTTEFQAEEEYDPTDSEEVSQSERFIKKSKRRFSPSSDSAGSGAGLIAGAHFNRLSTLNRNSISGSDLKGGLFVDFPIIEPLAIRIIVSYHTLSLKGDNCGLSKCVLRIQYPGIGAMLRGVFLRHTQFHTWVGGGGFLFWPLESQYGSGFLDKKSFSSFHGAVTGAGGVDIHFKGFYIPIQTSVNLINPVVISPHALKSNKPEFKPLYFGIKAGIAFSL